MKRFALCLALLILAACTPPVPPSTPVALDPQHSALAQSPQLHVLLIPPDATPDFSLLYPSLSAEPLWQSFAPELFYLAEDDAAQADPALWQLEVPPLPYFDDLPLAEHERIDRMVAYYSTGAGRRAFRLWLERAGRYMPMMTEVFAEEGLPRDLAYLALIESGFNTKAASWAHAVGPWQFIESSGRMYGLENDWWRDERRDPEKSTHAAARMLKRLHSMMDGDWALAIASYNAGPGRILRAMRQHKTRDYWQLIGYKTLQEETKNYVPKLMAALTILRDLDRYGFGDIEPLEPLEFDRVEIPSTTDLDLVARLAGVEYAEIKALNPELKRWCTPPDAKKYALRLPAGTAPEFLAAYSQLPEAERANYKHHRIGPGDTLLALAKQYGVRVQDIISLNRIANPRALRLGTDLVLPLSKNFTRLPVEELADDYVRTRRRTYTVRRGDSLWSIARRFDVGEKQLRVWNRLGWSNHLRPGQTLIVSAKAVRGKRASTAAAAGPRRKLVYQVRSGDTLWGIGRQFRVSTADIRSWNNLDADHVLRPGDKLTLMVPGKERG